MIIVDELKAGFDAMIHPDQGTKKGMGTVEALLFYYKFSIIPLVLYVIFSLVFLSSSLSGTSSPAPSGIATLATAFAGFSIIANFVYVWIVLPIEILIVAAFLQLVGKILLHKFSDGYGGSVAALVYGALPLVGLQFLFLVPLVGWVVGLIAFIWALVLDVFALANQQSVSKAASLGIGIAAGILISILVAIVAVVLGALFGLAILSAVQHVATTIPITH